MAPLVQQAFELYATGEWSLTKLHDEITRRGLRERGKPLALSKFWEMLRNPIYIGIVRWGGLEAVGNHEPLVSISASRAVGFRRDTPNVARDTDYVISGQSERQLTRMGRVARNGIRTPDLLLERLARQISDRRVRTDRVLREPHECAPATATTSHGRQMVIKTRRRAGPKPRTLGAPSAPCPTSVLCEQLTRQCANGPIGVRPWLSNARGLVGDQMRSAPPIETSPAARAA